MSKKTGLVCLLAAIFLPPSVGMSQQPVHWEPTLESAQRLAGQTNRLVLIHFWAPWCAVCKRMEAEVLTQPSVAAELNADYVSVKINADQLPATAERYGVTALPTTAIVSPEGQLLDSMRGWVDADPYVARLNQVAAECAQRRAALAQLPSRPQPPGGAVPPAMRPGTPPPSTPPAGGPPAAGQQVAAIPSLPPAGPSPAPVAAAPAYGASAVPAVASRYGPATAPPTTPRYGPSAAPGSQPPGPPQANPPQGIPPQVNPPQAVAGNPPWGLEGFCPVSLCEKQKWVRGDRRWGAIHRGRTYLFAGPEEQRRFLADPDRYAPVASGNDVVLAAEQGQIVPGMREHGVFSKGRVYLFSSEVSLQKFSHNPDAYDANRSFEALRSGANPGQPLR